MALGAITRHSAESGQTDEAYFLDFISFTGDSAYPTGGSVGFDALLQAAVGDNRDVQAVLAQDCGGYHATYDRAAGTLKVYYADYDAVADGPLIEVPDATNLSAVTFNLMVISK